jgi:fatty acid synthase subunit alpha
MFLKFLLAKKLNTEISKIQDNDTLVSLAKGNSALKNEIAGILINEFSLNEEQLEKETIQQLTQRINTTVFGKYMTKIINQMSQEKLPVNFRLQQAQEFLKEKVLNENEYANVIVEWLSQILKSTYENEENAKKALTMILIKKGLWKEEQKNETKQENVNVIVKPKKVEKDYYSDIKNNIQQKQQNKVISETYINSLQPIYDEKKVRYYQSWKNWTKQHQILKTSISNYLDNNMNQETPKYYGFNTNKIKKQKYDNSDYKNSIDTILEKGINFTNKTIFVTGSGQNSIAEQVIASFLFGGGHVYTTTSKCDSSNYKRYQEIYQNYGCKGSELHVIPCNIQNDDDIKNTISYIYKTEKHIDIFVPFQAIGMYNNVYNVSDIDELGFRLMTTQIYKFIGQIKKKKAENLYTQIILPLSPNIGIFGNDGMYADSKLALRSLYHKYHSENLKNDFLISGLKIGWTNSALMSNTAYMSDYIEQKYDIPTFTPEEMAFYVVALTTVDIQNILYEKVIEIDVSFGLENINNLGEVLRTLKKPVLSKTVNETKQSFLNIRKHINYPEISENDSKQKNVLLDLEKVVVCVGYGEFGPWGTSSIRWDIEKNKLLSLESCIELGFLCGYQKQIKELSPSDFYIKYHDELIQKCGLREIEDKKNRDICILKKLDDDMNFWITCDSWSEIEEYKQKYKEYCIVRENPDTKQLEVKLKKGASIYLNKSISTQFYVSGHVPTDFNPVSLGIPEHIIEQVDPIVIYAMVSLAEAFIKMGITDPYDMYNYIHPSELGNVIGSGIGGMKHIEDAFHRRKMNEDCKNDIIQDSLINVMPAWLNMLMLGACGPILTPVQACATSAVSIEMGMSLLLQKKALFVLTGGSEDTRESSMAEFGNIGALVNNIKDKNSGRSPSEASRPCTNTRSGFTESSGAGIQILTSARMALEHGFPIYGIVAHTHTACDGYNLSVPAPGKGILTSLRNCKLPFESLDSRISKIKNSISLGVDPEPLINHYIHDYGKGKFSSLQLALDMFGCTVDDINVVSFHGTSTKGNDFNESHIVHTQMTELKRSKNNNLFVVAQKYLTGHAKGSAFAFMFNGALDMIKDNVIPANNNLDDLGKDLKHFMMIYPNQNIHQKVNAVLLKSFGFGQAGAEVLILHPDFLLSQINPSVLLSYKQKRSSLELKSQNEWYDKISGQKNWIKIQSKPVLSSDSELYTVPDKSWSIPKYNQDLFLPTTINNLLTSFNDKISSIGIDIENIYRIDWDDTFITRNFTTNEIKYSENSRLKLLGMWSAKEAFIKAYNKDKKYEFSDLKMIEVIHDISGKPFILYNNNRYIVSISYTLENAIAIACI